MLGKLEKLDLRNVWKHEALDFTKWLTTKDNFDLLCNEIGLEMQVKSTEAAVGSFSADILAEETNTGNTIIIENQLEQTNHDHLGKIITYASGLEADYVIWIFKEIREEHRKAVDWLNEITNDEVSFFAIQLELWKIGDSLPAPKFNIVSSPNDWAKAMRASRNTDNLSDNNLFQLDFWKGLSDYLIENKSPLKPRKPRAQHWYNVSTGSSKAHISFIVSVKDHFIRCDFYISDDKDLFCQLHAKKDSIEQELGFEMDWQELPNAKASRVAVQKDLTNIKKPEDMKIAYEWYRKTGEAVARVFPKYI